MSMKLCGKNPVIERIKAAPGTIKKLYLKQRTELADVVKASKAAGIKFDSVDEKSFAVMVGDIHAQGVMAEVDDFVYANLEDIIGETKQGKTIPVYVDEVTDPQNLGAILRNLACLGGFSVIIPEHGSADINETVLRVASGGENYVKVAKITNNVRGVELAKSRGITILGAVSEGGGDILKSEIKYPCAVIIGSEGKGIRPGLLKLVDVPLTLPMWGARLSYNVAVATSLFCYEMNRRRMG
jgi:23S rRNA (guanosine2251-2'-O)-methyltransferase